MTTQSLSQLLITAPEIQTLLESSLWKEVADFINAIPVIANPEPQQDIPVSATLQDVLGLVTPQERFAIGETQAYRRILDAVNQSRFDWVVDNLTTLLGGGVELSLNQAMTQYYLL
ncbi:hypothetical protein 2AV2_37 [Nodularia phage vB_NpeS-2AV2]|uniref:Uncharacterized protein n=1 Tax=Nodularia phage vB_NpeS-2AV2 TaxID=1777122 RepID=A0A1L2BWS2_9CAUD|nr:hypothetical protein HWA92_gp037 [Nodularia phage vB_NpeS-2AV2]ALY07489.1 hypothetical protein 2AV2_37 [Nodularia phage vB_NpeS-2AV2]